MRRYLGALVTVIVGLAVVVAVLVTLSETARIPKLLAAPSDGTMNIDGANLKHVTLHLQTFPQSPYEDPDWVKQNYPDGMDNGVAIPPPGDNQDWVTYWPTTTFQVPAHSVVTVIIENYDGKSTLLNDFYNKPQGTFNNQVIVDGQAMNQVKSEDASHTFTIHSIPSSQQDWLYVSVPVTGVDDSAPLDPAGLMPLKPVVTEFTFETKGPGQYIWQCFDPCGSGFNGFGGPMSTKGYMSGTIDVV
ncbi:MAG: hypothetical protein ACM3N4_04190 [Nitrososphaerota archaeon]